LTLTAERQSARMSKITNYGLARCGTGCFIAVPYNMATAGVKGLTSQVMWGCTLNPLEASDRYAVICLPNTVRWDRITYANTEPEDLWI